MDDTPVQQRLGSRSSYGAVAALAVAERNRNARFDRGGERCVTTLNRFEDVEIDTLLAAVAEDGVLTEADATFHDVTLSPKTVGARPIAGAH
jgi:hypothetical protein